jgi:hypothetical protein
MRLIQTLKRKPVDQQSMISQATAIAAPIPLSPQRQTSRSFTFAVVPLPQAVASPATNEDGVAYMAVAGRTLRTDEDDGPKEGEDEEEIAAISPQPGAAVVNLTQVNTDEDEKPKAEEAVEVMSCVLPPTIAVLTCL